MSILANSDVLIVFIYHFLLQDYLEKQAFWNIGSSHMLIIDIG